MLLADKADVRQWLSNQLHVSRETQSQIDRFVDLLRMANEQQNLIAASTAGEAIWVRHIADSAQLLLHAAAQRGPWLDIGSGPGLPGLVVALCDSSVEMVLVESRRLRCAFLRDAIATLELDGRVQVVESPLEKMPNRAFATISARAFAPLPKLLALSERFATMETRWLLPKGRSVQNELSTVSTAWQRLFHVEPSLTDADAAILCATGVPRGKADQKQ